MSVERVVHDDPRLLAAASEMRGLIVARYPEATFELTSGDDRRGS
jgi:hypothetical protein